MNVAAVTSLIFGLLLPGVAFRRLYYTGEFSRQYFQESYGELAVRVAVIAVLFQVIGWGFSFGATRAALATVWGELLGAIFREPGWEIAAGPYAYGRFACVQFGLTAAAAIVGYASQLAVRRLGLDRRFKLLRFRNYWHYLLRGGIREFGGVRPMLAAGDGEVSGAYVDVLVATSEGDVLYDGLLADYELHPDNRLDKLVLMHARRRYLREDQREPSVSEGRYPIRGDFFVIPGDGLRDVNIRYLINVAGDAQGRRLALTDADDDTSSADYLDHPG